METIDDLVKRIKNIEWYMREDKGMYAITTNKGIVFSFADKNNVPLLKDNLKSKEWVAEEYSIFLTK